MTQVAHQVPSPRKNSKRLKPGVKAARGKNVQRQMNIARSRLFKMTI